MPKIISTKVGEVPFIVRCTPEVHLFIPRNIMVSMENHSLEGMSESKEVMGLLIGKLFQDDQGEYGMVTDVVSAPLVADETYVKFNHESIEELFETLDQMEERMIIGWYHSHPGYGCFLSQIDMATHLSIFGDGKGFAIVVDPMDGTVEVFTCVSSEQVSLKLELIEE